jgi:hypothetical protein
MVFAGKQMMLLAPKLPKRRAALLRGPIAPHQHSRRQADLTTAPPISNVAPRSWSRIGRTLSGRVNCLGRHGALRETR